jgi:lipid II:glycine glycyltransferase (peptidoglycan interpeptide bridge formation enzyme)
LTIAPSESEVSNEVSVRLNQVSPAEWNALLGGFDDASIYQTWSYGAVHWSPRQLSHLILRQNGKTIGMAQLRLVRIPVIGKGIAYLRWGPLFRPRGEVFRPEALKTMATAIKQEYVQRQGLMLRMLPPVFETDSFAGAFMESWRSLGLARNETARTYRTFRVDLTRPLEDIRKGLGAKWRNKLNGAEKNGLSITEGAGTDLYARFLAAYHEMMERKNFETTVDVTEFQRIQEDLTSDLKMQVFLCEREGKVLNALVVSAIGDTAIYLLGATSDEGLKLKGAYLLQWRAIQWIKSRGCRWYDLGGIDPVLNPGVYEFKSGFGGEESTHLGTLELSDGGVSAFCVRSAERIKAALGRLRASRKTAPSEKNRNAFPATPASSEKAEP